MLIFMYRRISKKEISIEDNGLKNECITVELKLCVIII